jgi:hypothetical protein
MKLNEVDDPHWIPDFEDLRNCMFLTELPDRETFKNIFLTDIKSHYPIVSLSSLLLSLNFNQS